MKEVLEPGWGCCKGFVMDEKDRPMYKAYKEALAKIFLQEMEKTDERLKEVGAILRERTNYLNNLERERQQALKFKQLQEMLKRCKASIIDHDLNIKKKEFYLIDSEIEKKQKAIEKLRISMVDIQSEIQTFELKIAKINSSIKESTGHEQESLNRQIADLRADLSGMNV